MKAQFRHRYSQAINFTVMDFENSKTVDPDYVCPCCGQDYNASDYISQYCSLCGFDNRK